MLGEGTGVGEGPGVGEGTGGVPAAPGNLTLIPLTTDEPTTTGVAADLSAVKPELAK